MALTMTLLRLTTWPLSSVAGFIEIDECKGFARLPNTMAFQYEPNPEERFPHHPIFAHAHADDVGCWVTVDGRVDGE